MRGGAHTVLKAISLLHSFSARLMSLLTSGGFLTSKQETPNAAPAAPNNKPLLITCGEGNAFMSSFLVEFIPKEHRSGSLEASAGQFLIFDKLQVTRGRHVWILSNPAHKCLKCTK